MSPQLNIIFKTIVRSFYIKNMGLFLFLAFIMIASVGRANGVGLLEYHTALIRGILASRSFFVIILVVWFLYYLKLQQFILDTLRRPDHGFLSLFSRITNIKLTVLFLLAQIILLLPVSLYAIIVAAIAYHDHQYTHVFVMTFFFILLTIGGPLSAIFQIQNSGNTGRLFPGFKLPLLKIYYQTFFIRYIMAKRKMLVLVIKGFSCTVLCLMLSSREVGEYDLRMFVLFYCFGLFGHGVLIHELRGLDDRQLSFYRSLPISLLGRFLGYSWFYFLLFLPETSIIILKTPGHLIPPDAALLILLGYGIFMGMHSLLYIKSYKRVDFIKILTGLYFMIFIGALMHILWIVSILIYLLAVSIFFNFYYSYEITERNG